MRMRIWNLSKSWQVSQIYGTLIFIGLTVYFLLMYAIGAIHIISLRFLNVFIMLAGVYYALQQYKRTHDGELTYFRVLTLGSATAFVGATTFGLFLFFFLKIEGSLMQSIQQNETIGRYLNPYIAACVVMMEGALSGFGLSYLLGNYLKTEKDSVPQGGEIKVKDKHGNFKTRFAKS